MKKSISRRATILGIAASILVLPVAAQYGGDRSREVAGTWMLVSLVNTQPDGQKSDVMGSNPKGKAIFTPDGHFSVNFTRDGLPKFASGNRVKGTPEENQAVVQGSISYFGTYSTDGADGTDRILSQKVEGSTFPAWIGEVQKRKFTIAGDQLQWVGIVGTGGGTVVATLRRVK
ncbi:MAG: lipocalin-like domain-containing protein [Usitatibacter sp.]